MRSLSCELGTIYWSNTPTPAGERSVPAARFTAKASELKNPEHGPGFSNYQP
jgi:hypothetical protein